MPSYKYPTRGYSGGWQGPGSGLYTYNGGWQVPKNAFYSNGAGGWVRFFGDDIAFNHGSLYLRGAGEDVLQGGEGGDPFYIHYYGYASYCLNPDGTVEYFGGGASGSGPTLSYGRWAEVGIDASKYEAKYIPLGGDWVNLGSRVEYNFGGLAEGVVFLNGDFQIRHAATGNVLSSFNLTVDVD
jgi:hypothetical protein